MTPAIAESIPPDTDSTERTLPDYRDDAGRPLTAMQAALRANGLPVRRSRPSRGWSCLVPKRRCTSCLVLKPYAAYPPASGNLPGTVCRDCYRPHDR